MGNSQKITFLKSKLMLYKRGLEKARQQENKCSEKEFESAIFELQDEIFDLIQNA